VPYTGSLAEYVVVRKNDTCDGPSIVRKEQGPSRFGGDELGSLPPPAGFEDPRDHRKESRGFLTFRMKVGG